MGWSIGCCLIGWARGVGYQNLPRHITWFKINHKTKSTYKKTFTKYNNKTKTPPLKNHMNYKKMIKSLSIKILKKMWGKINPKMCLKRRRGSFVLGRIRRYPPKGIWSHRLINRKVVLIQNYPKSACLISQDKKHKTINSKLNLNTNSQN